MRGSNLFRYLLKIFFLSFVISSCSQTSMVNTDKIFLYDDNRLIYYKNGKQHKIHQRNGITIVGNLWNGRINGSVEIITRNKSYRKKTFDSYRVFYKEKYSNSNLDDFVLFHLDHFERHETTGKENIYSGHYIKYKIRFYNKEMYDVSEIEYSNGVKLTAKIKLLKDGDYIKDIVPYGEAKLTMPDGDKYEVTIKNKGYFSNNAYFFDAHLLGSYKVESKCFLDEVNVPSFRYDLCLSQFEYTKKFREALNNLKDYIEHSKKTKKYEGNDIVLSKRYSRLWKKVIDKADSRVADFNDKLHSLRSKYTERIFSFHNESETVSYDGRDVVKALLRSNKIDVRSDNFFMVTELNSSRVTLDSKAIFGGNTHRNKYIEKLIKSFYFNALLDEVLKVLTGDGSYLDKNVYFVVDKNIPPSVDVAGNLYLSANKKYSEDEIYLIMLHEAVHLSSRSSVRKLVHNELIDDKFYKIFSELGLDIDELINFATLNDITISRLKNEEFEADLFTLDMISDDLDLVDLYIKMIDDNSNGVEENEARVAAMKKVREYYSDGGNAENIIKAVTLFNFNYIYEKVNYANEAVRFDDHDHSLNYHVVTGIAYNLEKDFVENSFFSGIKDDERLLKLILNEKGTDFFGKQINRKWDLNLKFMLGVSANYEK